MITIVAGAPADPALPIVLAAFQRSVTPGLVRVSDRIAADDIGVFVNPRDELSDVLSTTKKSIVFGAVGPRVAALCGLADPGPLPGAWGGAAGCTASVAYHSSVSGAFVHWSQQGLGASSPYPSRPFLRFDFANEWNNLGYGRIAADGGVWALANSVATDGAVTLAEARAAGLKSVPMVTLADGADRVVLYWNRSTGPVDSAEWAVIETFVADWRSGDQPVVPVIEEIPFGADGVITMRLDCDEAIASARSLFELYRSRALPFSVAIKTDQSADAEDIALLAEIRTAGGAILSHSVSHTPQWGGSVEACAAEARASSDWLEARVPGLKVRNAVSPFHQNPPYVSEGLRRAGLRGFIGGIIANDPEALLARGGILPADATGVVTHSQQCMLHGDCMLSEGDALAIPKAAFRAALRTRTLFGYLDHPFSSRYTYGWSSEESRLAAHVDFLDFIAAETIQGRTCRWNEDQTLDWIWAKSQLRLTPTRRHYRVAGVDNQLPEFAVRLAGRSVALSEFIDG